jgi:hypothetical protein
MTLYFFDLRDGGRGYRDPEGVDLPDDDAAKDHAQIVAAELIKDRNIKARHWRIDVRDGRRKKICRVALISHDPRLSHLSPPLKKAMEELSDRCHALCEATAEARGTLLRSKALIAKYRRRPYLAVDHGEEILEQKI